MFIQRLVDDDYRLTISAWVVNMPLITLGLDLCLNRLKIPFGMVKLSMFFSIFVILLCCFASVSLKYAILPHSLNAVGK